MDTGSIVVKGVEPGVIAGAVKFQTSEDILKKPVAIPSDYAIENKWNGWLSLSRHSEVKQSVEWYKIKRFKLSDANPIYSSLFSARA